jgi:hypothetical protein
MLRNPGSSVSDEGNYTEWRRTIRSASRIMSVERHLPQSFSRFFRLPNLEEKYVDQHSALGDSLVASGYLTNVSITMTNPQGQRMQIVNRLTKAFPGRDNEWEFYIRSNTTLVITCRPQYVPVCNQALENN